MQAVIEDILESGSRSTFIKTILALLIELLLDVNSSSYRLITEESRLFEVINLIAAKVDNNLSDLKCPNFVPASLVDLAELEAPSWESQLCSYFGPADRVLNKLTAACTELSHVMYAHNRADR